MNKKTRYMSILILALIFLCGCTDSASDIQNFPPDKSLPPSEIPSEAAGRRIPIQEKLEMEDIESAKGYAKSCTARVEIQDDSGGWFGTAVLWDQTRETVLLAVSAHLLVHAQDKVSVSFPGQTDGKGELKKYEAAVTGISESFDIGFLELEKGLLTEDEFSRLRCVRLHQRIFDTLAEGDPCFSVGCSESGAADMNLDFTLESIHYKAADLESVMLLLDGGAAAGMSGSGVFDGYGNFIGMITAGAGEKTAALPMTLVNAAYREICGRSRDTEDYE